MTAQLVSQFAVTVRGYDRTQVDEYVDSLREWLENATFRMEAAETENAHFREQVSTLRSRVAQLEQQVRESPPRTMSALGERVTQILELAQEGATAVHADADVEALAIVGRARQEAGDLMREARTRQAEMEAFIAGAGEQATAVVQQAEARGAETATRIIVEAESRARALLAEAEGRRARTLAKLDEERDAIGGELQRLTAERDELRDGLTRLRESLHRTISELPGAPPPPSRPQSR